MNLDAPHVHPLSNELYQLDHAFRVMICGYGITVKEGFVTDGASIPRLLWRVVGHPFQGRVLAPALVHDAMYQSEILPRAKCDRIFHALLLANGVNKVKARVLYWGVRMGGGYVWDDHDLAGIEEARQFIRVVPTDTPECKKCKSVCGLSGKCAMVAGVLAMASGCTMPFSGERDVNLKLNILGNTVEWQSKMAGSYQQTQHETELAR